MVEITDLFSWGPVQGGEELGNHLREWWRSRLCPITRSKNGTIRRLRILRVFLGVLAYMGNMTVP